MADTTAPADAGAEASDGALVRAYGDASEMLGRIHALGRDASVADCAAYDAATMDLISRLASLRAEVADAATRQAVAYASGVGFALSTICDALDMGGVTASKLAEMLGRPIGELHPAGLQRVANALYDACHGEKYEEERDDARAALAAMHRRAQAAEGDAQRARAAHALPACCADAARSLDAALRERDEARTHAAALHDACDREEAAHRATCDQLDAARSALADAQVEASVPRWKYDEQVTQTARAEAERDRARIACGVAAAEDVWSWQGRGDRPESLTCPVVMSAETLRTMLARLSRATERGDAMREAIWAARGAWGVVEPARAWAAVADAVNAWDARDAAGGEDGR